MLLVPLLQERRLLNWQAKLSGAVGSDFVRDSERV